MNAPTYSTVALLATAYPGANAKASLTHTLMTFRAEDGSTHENVLCNRIKLASVADECATSPHAAPTCPLCSKRDPRSKSGGPFVLASMLQIGGR